MPFLMGIIHNLPPQLSGTVLSKNTQIGNSTRTVRWRPVDRTTYPSLKAARQVAFRKTAPRCGQR
jgi:hypothetical protein